MKKRKRDNVDDKPLKPPKLHKKESEKDVNLKSVNKIKLKVNPLANWNKIKDMIPDSSKTPKKLSSQKVPLKEKEEIKTTNTIEDKPLKPSVPTWDLENKEITKVLALDCEMVGVGVNGLESMLARVCIVNAHGAVLYDEFVASTEKVVDYRTKYSGIRPKDLHPSRAKPFKEVQQKVAEIIENRIVVGHGLENDFRVLMLDHPFLLRRDTAKYRPFQRAKAKPHALRYLVKVIFGIEIQKGEHDPAEDARCALMLYFHVKAEWDKHVKKLQKLKRKKKK